MTPQDYQQVAFDTIFPAIFPGIVMEDLMSWAMRPYRKDKFSMWVYKPSDMRIAWKNNKPKTNRLLHFTSLKNAISILREGSIKAFNVDKFEDALEFNYFYDCLKKDLSRDDEAYRNNKFILSGVSPEILDSPTELMLWRTFGDSGRGCALEFEVDLSSDFSDVYYGNIFYNSPNSDMIQDALKEFKHKTNGIEFVPDELFQFAAFFYKHPSYSLEQEVRLFVENGAYPISDTWEFHDGKLIPFTKIALKSNKNSFSSCFLSLNSIRFGPRVSNSEDIFSNLRNKLFFNSVDDPLKIGSSQCNFKLK